LIVFEGEDSLEMPFSMVFGEGEVKEMVEGKGFLLHGLVGEESRARELLMCERGCRGSEGVGALG
jgi:hypothetical protein